MDSHEQSEILVQDFKSLRFPSRFQRKISAKYFKILIRFLYLFPKCLKIFLIILLHVTSIPGESLAIFPISRSLYEISAVSETSDFCFMDI